MVAGGQLQLASVRWGLARPVAAMPDVQSKVVLSVEERERMGLQFRAARKAAGHTVERAAEIAGLSVSHIGNIERGSHPITKVNEANLVRLPAAFGMTPQRFVDTAGVIIVAPRGTPGYEAFEPQWSGAPDERPVPLYARRGRSGPPEGWKAVEAIGVPAAWPGVHAAYELDESRDPEVPGDAVVAARVDAERQLGQLVAAWVPQRGVVAHRLAAVTPEHQGVLASRNPDYARLVAPDALILGEIVQYRRDLRRG